MPDDGTLSQEQIAADTNRRVGELADAGPPSSGRWTS